MICPHSWQSVYLGLGEAATVKFFRSQRELWNFFETLLCCWTAESVYSLHPQDEFSLTLFGTFGEMLSLLFGPSHGGFSRSFSRV